MYLYYIYMYIIMYVPPILHLYVHYYVCTSYTAFFYMYIIMYVPPILHLYVHYYVCTSYTAFMCTYVSCGLIALGAFIRLYDTSHRVRDHCHISHTQRPLPQYTQTQGQTRHQMTQIHQHTNAGTDMSPDDTDPPTHKRRDRHVTR